MEMSATPRSASLALVSTGPEAAAQRLILRREAEVRTGLPSSTLREMVRKGTFPEPVRLTPRLIAFVEAEVDAWISARISGRKRRKTAS